MQLLIIKYFNFQPKNIKFNQEAYKYHIRVQQQQSHQIQTRIYPSTEGSYYDLGLPQLFQ